MKVRSFGADDFPLYLKMAKALYAGEATLHPADETAFERNFAAIREGSPFISGLIIEAGEKDSLLPAGYAILAHSWASEFGHPLVVVEELFIDGTFRGQGLGSAFFGWLRDTYPGHCSRLEVAPNNAGVLELYRRQGYEDWGYLQMFYGQTPIKE